MTKNTFNYAPAGGSTVDELRASLPKSLYRIGDAKLVWVNEGDLYNLAATGIEITKHPVPEVRQPWCDEFGPLIPSSF